MNQARIAIPSAYPGGLKAELGAHFGHCDLYTLVDIKEGRIAQVSTLPNVPHQQGGCLAPVNHLAQHGVTVLIAGGMGFRPLMGFNQAGIEVYHGADAPNVDEAVKALIDGSLQRFTRDHTCGGGDHHHGEGHAH
jgi:predicted Fe-Mo cluster-binding NifX family protein